MDRVHKHYKLGKRIPPIHIDIGVTKLCNARCVYCYGIFQKLSGDIIPKSTLMRLFKDAPTCGVKSLAIIGDGDPTLNSGIYDAITVGKDSGLDIAFGTNGILLDDDKLLCLLSSCAWLRFNLSAVDKQRYLDIHGVDKWGQVKGNIIRAAELKSRYGLKCTIGLQMVLIPDCVEQVIPEAQFALDTGVDYFVIKQFSDPQCDEMSRFSLTWYDNPEVLDILKRAEAMSTDKTAIIPKWNTISSKGVRPYDHCVDCPLIFQISGNGKAYPCGYLFGDDRYCYGDLNKQSLGEILYSEHYWGVIKYMRERFDVHKDCAGCCRHDHSNKFIWGYLHPPVHLNFI